MKSVSSRRSPSRPAQVRVVASRSSVTADPLGVRRSSGSNVRRPMRKTLFKSAIVSTLPPRTEPSPTPCAEPSPQPRSTAGRRAAHAGEIGSWRILDGCSPRGRLSHSRRIDKSKNHCQNRWGTERDWGHTTRHRGTAFQAVSGHHGHGLPDAGHQVSRGRRGDGGAGARPSLPRPRPPHRRWAWRSSPG